MFPPAKVHQRLWPALRREWRQAMTRLGVSSGSLHAANGVDAMIADVVGERLVIERFGLADRLGENLSGGVGIGRIGEAERIDAQPRRPLLVLVQKCVGAGELQAGGRNVELVVDESVDQR